MIWNGIEQSKHRPDRLFFTCFESATNPQWVHGLNWMSNSRARDSFIFGIENCLSHRSQVFCINVGLLIVYWWFVRLLVVRWFASSRTEIPLYRIEHALLMLKELLAYLTAHVVISVIHFQGQYAHKHPVDTPLSWLEPLRNPSSNTRLLQQ